MRAIFKNKYLRRATQSELARRGGKRYYKQNIPPGKADKRAGQLRSGNRRKLGEQINESKRAGRITAQNESARNIRAITQNLTPSQTYR